MKGTNTFKTGTPNGPSYRNILQGENKVVTPLEQRKNTSKPYIVEQTNCVAELNIEAPETEEYRSTFETQAIICRFNCYWPKPMEMFHWIFTNWTMDCEKGYFIVKFPSQEA